MEKIKLRDGWYTLAELDAADLDVAGIYQWEIEGVGIYVGKALKLGKRIRAYPNNVRRMIQGLHWHGDASKEYRRVHHALREAYEAGNSVAVRILERCDPAERKKREDEWIARRRAEHLAGGPPVLND